MDTNDLADTVGHSPATMAKWYSDAPTSRRRAVVDAVAERIGGRMVASETG